MHARTTWIGLLAVMAIAGATTAAAEAPVAASRFGITIDGVQIASFGAAQVQAGKRPPQLVLRQGGQASMEMNAWLEAAQAGSMGAARRNAVLVEFDASGTPVQRWKLVGAAPTKGGAGGGGRLQVVTIVCERIQRVGP